MNSSLKSNNNKSKTNVPKNCLSQCNITQEFQNSTEHRRNQQLQDSAGGSRIQKLENSRQQKLNRTQNNSITLETNRT